MKLTQLDRIEAKLDLFNHALVMLLYGETEEADDLFKQHLELFHHQSKEHLEKVKQTIELEKEEQNGVDEN